MIKSSLVLPLVDQALVSGATFVSTILLARHMPIDQFGAYSVAWTFVIYLVGIQTALILFPMMSLGPQKSHADRDQFFSELMSQQIAFAILCAAVMAAAAVPMGIYFLSDLSPWSFAPALGAACGASQLQEFLRRLLFTEGRPVAALICDVLRCGGQVGMLVLAFTFGFDTIDVILWIVAGTASVAVLAFPAYLARARLEPSKLLRQFQRNWHFSSWLVGSSLVTGIGTLAGTMLTGVFLGPAAVAAARAAGVLGGVSGVFMQALQNVVPMQAARHFSGGGAKALESYLVRMGLVVTSLIGIFGLALSVAPELWLHVLYGEKYAGFGYVLVWTAVMYYANSFEFPLGIGLRTAERTRPSFVAYVVGSISTLIFIYPAATLFGLSGVLALTSANFVLQNLILLSGLRGALRDKLRLEAGDETALRPDKA